MFARVLSIVIQCYDLGTQVSWLSLAQGSLFSQAGVCANGTLEWHVVHFDSNLFRLEVSRFPIICKATAMLR